MASDNYNNALNELKSMLKLVNQEAKIFKCKDKVIKDFKNDFSHSNVKSLKEERLKCFLHMRNNHHWTGLDRQTKNLLQNFDNLKDALYYATDEAINIEQRIDYAINKVNGLKLGILTPILMITNEDKYGVVNSKVEAFFKDYGLMPIKNKKSNEKYKHINNGIGYEQINSILHKFAEDLSICLWKLDALFFYYSCINHTNNEIRDEIKSRIGTFDKLNKDENNFVGIAEIKKTKLKPSQGGITVKKLKCINEPVILSIYNIEGNFYEYTGNYLECSYPNTGFQAKADDIFFGMTSVMKYKIPIFVLLEDKSCNSKIKIQIGLIEDYDSNRHKFLIHLLDNFPSFDETRDKNEKFNDDEFEPFDYNDDVKKALVKIRGNQEKFRFDILKIYGNSCCVCGFNKEKAIEAAHIIPKSEKGTDDPRNGLPMCANHHRLFDAYYFAFDKDTNVIIKKGENLNSLNITKENLKHLKNLPNEKALLEREKIFNKYKLTE